MCKILEKERIASNAVKFIVKTENISRRCLPGQFIIVRLDEKGERVPFTIADYNKSEKTITLIVQEVGKTSYQMCQMEPGEKLYDIVGPLGSPTHIDLFGVVVCIGGGVGIAEIYPVAKALKEHKNKVISIIGARTKDYLFWEEKMASISDEIIVCTDDGTYGRKCLVTEPLKELIEKDMKIDRVFSAGPAIMQKYIAITTKPYNIKTIASIAPIMVDGTGMCGACRVEVDGKTKFACVDGPDFDAHKVNFELLLSRLKMYEDKEKLSYDRWRGE